MMDKQKAKEEVGRLVEKYARVVEEKRADKYSEEETKKDFILPLFRALGWNVEDSSEVSAEEKISKKRVDYGFRINGIPKFFLEAKPLRANLDVPKYIEQAINYAWHKGCTWAVLTDFESIKIFNAEWKTSSPFQNHLKTIPCYEFIDRFEELWLLSKESFEQGLLDKEAEKWVKKTKKIPVDKQLLTDFTRFREHLSKNIMKLNQSKNLTEEELDESVQRILDRLIFIRNCEDRGLEEKKLWEAKNERRVWKKVKEIFEYYDKNYNSKLFTYDLQDPKNVHLCDTLAIDDELLRNILESLYQTKDRAISYDFSAIEADVLGNIYEQYLGHILKKSEKRAKLKESRARRKEQGIYYTPTYIVDYIVRNTLGELLKDKKVDVEKIKVLDPACGSGSFLIKAFDVLNEYYSKRDKNYAQSELDFESDSKTGVPFTTKVKILKNNIFGVDLDKQAVEIAQLNLLLKIAEKGQRLPLLQQNIKCGNSLIDDPEIAGDKAFKWEEQFKEIMDAGGFDVVIGNPPYVRQEALGEIKNYFSTHYEVYAGTADLYSYFIERSLKLLKDGGMFGFIVSNKWMRARYGGNLRRFVASKNRLEQIIDFGELPVFEQAATFPCILIIKKGGETKNFKYVPVKKLEPERLPNLANEEGYFVEIRKTDHAQSWSLVPASIDRVLDKVKSKGIPLGEYVKGKIYYGIKTGLNEAFVIDATTRKRLIQEDSKSAEIIVPFVVGDDVRRYHINFRDRFLILTQIGIDIKRYPAVFKHLEQYKKELEKRWDKGNYWWELRACDYYEEFEKPKIMYPVIAKSPRFAFDDTGYFSNDKTFIIPTDSYFLLALLNSNLIWFYLKRSCSVLGDPEKGGRLELRAIYLSKIPIRTIDFNNPTDKKLHDQLVALVDKMLSLHARLNALGDKATDERKKIEEEIAKTDRKIDELVYRLYNITDEEKKIIEQER